MLTTEDLFLGGLALCRGGELLGVEVRGTNGRRMAFFQISGPAAETAQRDYYQGMTAVDLPLLKLQVRRLKERAFLALREEEENRHASPGRDRGCRSVEAADAEPARSRRR